MSGIDWDRFLPPRKHPNIPEYEDTFGTPRRVLSPILEYGPYAFYRVYGPYFRNNRTKTRTAYFLLENKEGKRVRLTLSKFKGLYPDFEIDE